MEAVVSPSPARAAHNCNAAQTDDLSSARRAMADAEARGKTMPTVAKRITPCLWFDDEAEDAANFYVSVFKNAKIGRISRYGKEGREIHGREAGSVMTVEFEIDGQPFVALNGGPHFRFSEAISFQVHCDTQEEIDYFWSRLTEGGQEVQCGWLKDKFGLSWQIVPTVLPKMLTDPDPAKSQRVTRAFLQMKKFDIAALERAYEGRSA
jgi:predicted 3-demethylubiquinone-9 3-methyltransferase (glyoxalase superfamily)